MQRDLKQLDEQILELMKERVTKTNSEHVSEIEQLTKQLDLIASTVSYKATFTPSPLVGYQGVSGAFSEQACQNFFSKDVKTIGYPEFEDVYIALKNGDIDYGVLPIENSSTGAINDNYDLIRKYGFYIVGETAVNVDQCLMGIKGTKLEDIKEVYSHPQGLAQSSDFFFAHRYMNPMPYKDTAMAAQYVSEAKDPTKAAIASRLACELYGLEMLQEAIQNDKTNKTRFMVVSREFISPVDSDKVSVIFTLPHVVGSLSTMLEITALYGVNLEKIESRPIKEENWQYYFYIDFLVNMSDGSVSKAIEEMKTKTSTFRLLGNYKKA